MMEGKKISKFGVLEMPHVMQRQGTHHERGLDDKMRVNTRNLCFPLNSFLFYILSSYIPFFSRQ